jgi:hypothetical protein
MPLVRPDEQAGTIYFRDDLSYFRADLGCRLCRIHPISGGRAAQNTENRPIPRTDHH